MKTLSKEQIEKTKKAIIEAIDRFRTCKICFLKAKPAIVNNLVEVLEWIDNENP